MRDRAVARLRAHRLDLALSAGASPEASAALALRAQRLTSLPHRRLMAETYRRIVREACEGRRRGRVPIAPPRRQVTAARDDLVRLADALAQPGPVAAQGAAQALLLLTDGTGPLYTRRAEANLPAIAGDAARALRLR
jgi:hypothetical protein